MTNAPRSSDDKEAFFAPPSPSKSAVHVDVEMETSPAKPPTATVADASSLPASLDDDIDDQGETVSSSLSPTTVPSPPSPVDASKEPPPSLDAPGRSDASLRVLRKRQQPAPPPSSASETECRRNRPAGNSPRQGDHDDDDDDATTTEGASEGASAEEAPEGTKRPETSSSSGEKIADANAAIRGCDGEEEGASSEEESTGAAAANDDSSATRDDSGGGQKRGAGGDDDSDLETATCADTTTAGSVGSTKEAGDDVVTAARDDEDGGNEIDDDDDDKVSGESSVSDSRPNAKEVATDGPSTGVASHVGGTMTSRRKAHTPPPPPSGSSEPSVRSSARFEEADIALSVLLARPRDEATGRRVSTLGTTPADGAAASTAAAAAAAAVGAFASKRERDEEDAAAKKEEAQRRRSSRSDNSTFQDRFMRKLEESRGNSESVVNRRRSSRYSTTSSVQNIGEEEEEEKEEGGMSSSRGADSSRRGSDDIDGGGDADIDDVGRADRSEDRAPARIPEATDIAERSSASNPPPEMSRENDGSRRPSHRLAPRRLSSEEYEDFVRRKISSRDVGSTTTHSVRRQIASLDGGRRRSSSAAAAATRAMGDDDEEEKVELSSGDREDDEDVVAAEGLVNTSEGNPRPTTSRRISGLDCVAAPTTTLTAACAAAAVAGTADSREEPLRAPSFRRISSLDDGGDDSSPFSSVVAERRKVEAHDGSRDPEDSVVPADDCAPDALAPYPAVSNARRASSRRHTTDVAASLTGSVANLLHGIGRSRSSVENASSARRPPDEADVPSRRWSTLSKLADMVDARDVVEARLVPEERPIETVEAIPMDYDDGADAEERRRRDKRRKLRTRAALVWIPLTLLVIAISVAAVTIGGKGGGLDGGSDGEGTVPAPMPERPAYDPTLVQVRREGVLRCGVPDKYGFATRNEVTGEREGMSVDLCTAVAAAVLGPGHRVELIEVNSITRFTSLAGRDIDLLIWGDTHTMERDFHEGRAMVGFQFTDPYFYDGLGFAGSPLAVRCADDYDWRGDCGDLKICVNGGTTHVDILRRIFPDPNIVLRDTKDAFLQEFVDGGCNVIAGEQNDISVASVRKQGYTGEFENGEEVLSKEPLAMVTRKGDQSWTDVVNWVLRALIHAEMTNISQENANEFDPGHDHGDHYDIMINFVGAVEAVGNYGDIYARNMEEVVPRKGLNLIYTSGGEDQSGLHYSHPTGTIDGYRHDFAPDGKINQILTRGKLICGIIGDEKQSMETDYCHALSASLFASDSSRVEFVKLSNEDDLMEKMVGAEVDVIAGAPVDFHSDVMPSNETASGLSGMALTQPYFHGGNHSDQGSSGTKAMATSQTDADWSTFVFWVVANSIWAEESGITSADFREVPEVKMFGDKFEWMFRSAILAIGNYGEIYERNIEHLPPRADQNQNLLNDGSSPQLWHPPF